MQKVFTFAIPMVVTVPVTILLCRLLVARKRKISLGTVFFSAFVVTAISLGFFTQGDIYTIGFWNGSRAKPPDREVVLKVIAFMILTCALPALAVVRYYQKQTKQGATTAASQ